MIPNQPKVIGNTAWFFPSFEAQRLFLRFSQKAFWIVPYPNNPTLFSISRPYFLQSYKITEMQTLHWFYGFMVLWQNRMPVYHLMQGCLHAWGLLLYVQLDNEADSAGIKYETSACSMAEILLRMVKIEYAAKHLFQLIWAEHSELEQLKKEMLLLEPVVRNGYSRAQFMFDNAETPDDVMEGVGVQFETYFGPDKEVYGKITARQAIEERLSLRHFSISSLCGNLLQYAKQGISSAHGSLGACPEGRLVGTQPLKNILWQGRNQAMHWEEGNPHPQVVQCFTALSTNIDPEFSQYTARNMAFDVVKQLNWKSFDDFKADLLSLQ